jgi:hypothetical protein
MRLVLVAFVLSACGSTPSGSVTADAQACDASGVVQGTFGGGGPTNAPPYMFGPLITVETWDADTTGSQVRHLLIADAKAQLLIRLGGQTDVADVGFVDPGDGEARLPGTGTFTRTGDPCAQGTFEAVFNDGVLSGMYRGKYLGLNPPRP